MESSAPKRRRTSPRTSVPVASGQPTPLRFPPVAGPDANTPDSTGGLSQALKRQLEIKSAARDGTAKATHLRDGNGDHPQEHVDEGRPHTQDPFARRGLRRSPLHAVPEVIVPEPELPPTPERPDPVVSTPPSGIHNTPSRRPKRNRALAENIKSSSPLKQPPAQPSEGAEIADAPPTLRSPSKKSRPSPLAAPAPTTAELRGLKPIDEDAEKRKLRDNLFAEIAQLEKDLSLASAENERIRQAHLSKRAASPPPNQSEILDLLIRRTLPQHETDPSPDPATDWLSSALNPIAFLPFSKPGELPNIFPSREQQQEEEKEEKRPIISHHPLPMSAEESLPFLQVFTPLSFTSHVFPLPRADDSSPLFQRHSIAATSTSPIGLFTARIEMTVNTKTLGISELAVPKIDPAAAAELGPFIGRVVQKPDHGIPGSGLYNNISVLTWAMGEWLRVSAQRAKVWSCLEQEVGDEKRLREMVKGMRERKAKRRTRKTRKRRRDEEGDESEGDEDDGEGGDGGVGEDEMMDKKKWEARDLLPFMGRTCLDLQVPNLSSNNREDGETCALRVVWRIHFDWTGEARSEIGVLVGVPAKWHKHDERGQLSGIPKLFDELIQGGEEPLAAMRTVVSLLCGEQRS